MIEEFQEALAQFDKSDYLQIAIADIYFKFPESCRYPNLCVKIDDFGLINPLEGRTVATLPEIHLACYLKAEITYYSAVVIYNYPFADENENGGYMCQEHLFRLYTLRNDAKKNDQELLQQLYKTYSNSLYGKLSQGISERRMYNTRDGATKRLPKSAITNSYYASMTTGLIRAALSSLIVALDELIAEGHNYKIISATTDGLLYGIDETVVPLEATLDVEHAKYNYDSLFEALQNGYKRFHLFERVDPLLASRLSKFPSLELLKISHKSWNDPEYIEIKHVANKVVNIKTRGQVGIYEENGKSICTLLAKAGHKVQGSQDEQAQWILNHYKDARINKYNFTTLSNIQEIINEYSPIDDLVSIPQERIISLDYDYKRYPINAHDTAPHRDINQFIKFRQSAEYLKRLGERASVDSVDYKYKRALQNIRKTGSNKEFCMRHILRALLHDVKPFTKPAMSYAALASHLREYGVTVSKIKHAKGAKFTPNMVQDTTGNRAFIRKVLKHLKYETTTKYSQYLELLLHKKISNPETVSYLD